MGGRIDCYIDLASFYSFFAFSHLIENLPVLEAHGVHVEFHPVFLGAINNTTGNQPPWKLPARGTYLNVHETARAKVHFHRPKICLPEDLMAVGMTILPLRCLHYVKSTYPRETYHALLEHLFRKFWYPPNANLTKIDVMAQALTEFGRFSPGECKAVLEAAKSPEVKDVLTCTTQDALDKGAFGAPWLWVTNEKGKAEPFFGSDRFHYVWKFLGLPYQDVALLPPSEKPKL